MLPTHNISSHTIHYAGPRTTSLIVLVAEEVVWEDLWFKGLGEGNRKRSG